MGRLLERLANFARPQVSPGVHRVLLALATAVFVGGAILALRALDIRWESLRWAPLLATAFLAVPAAIVANTYEYLLSARILGHRVRFGPALRLTVLSTAGNLLPLPGGVLVRVHGLRGLGSTYRRAASSTFMIGVAWIAVSAVVASLVLAVRAQAPAAVAFGGVGLVGVSVFWAFVSRIVLERHTRRRLIAATVLAELAAVVIDAVRLWLVLQGLGIASSIGQTTVLAVSASLAAATGVFPGGMGLREVIAAALAPVVGLSAPAGFLATALSRLIGTVVLGVLAGLLALRGEHAGPATRGARDQLGGW